jgi:hypothetical protein
MGRRGRFEIARRTLRVAELSPVPAQMTFSSEGATAIAPIEYAC